MSTQMKYLAQRDYVMGVALPQETRTYKPVSHSQVIDLTLESLAKEGLTLKSERYLSSGEGQVVQAFYTIGNVADNEMGLEIGWLNSYNKSKKLTYALGSQVWICSNGMVSADMGAFKKKHQGDVHEFAPATIQEYIKRGGDVFRQLQKQREEMKQVTIDKRIKAELIGRMFLEENILQSYQVGIIRDNMVKPEYDYNCPDTMWELYQLTTQSMKGLHPTLWMEQHIKVHNFFTQESGIVVPKVEIVAPPIGSHPQADLFRNEEYDEVLANIDY